MAHVKGHIRDRFLYALEAHAQNHATADELTAACTGLGNCTDLMPSDAWRDAERVLNEDLRGKGTYASCVRALRRSFVG